MHPLSLLKAKVLRSPVIQDSFRREELRTSELYINELAAPPALHTHRKDVPGNLNLHVPFQVLGWAMTLEELEDWTDRHCPHPDATRDQKRLLAFFNIRRELGCDGHAMVVCDPTPEDPGFLKWCFFFASNWDREEMDKMANARVINVFRVVLDVETPPKWYKVDVVSISSLA
ncbi:hypothetical protein C0992_006039 [Termitomyces sp. T32_za158]|nr:hypothetical protein C0992_006039 [Termitomyces sp. T32_za158]